MVIHLLFAGLGLLFAGLVAFACYCYREHKTVRDGLSTLEDAFKRDKAKIDASLIAKFHALENGGHLATGTAQSLLEDHVDAVSGTNGGQPAATLTPAT